VLLLRQNDVPKAVVDQQLGKYELLQLAKTHSVEFPDDAKEL
jgi:hypothetical protein